MNKLGILGGTFDPLHNGHLKIADATQKSVALDKVMFIPSYIPPHRDTPAASEKHRMEMVRIAIHGLSYAELSTVEIDRKGPSYMVDTLTELTKKYPSTALFLMLGTDAMELFHTWRLPLDILGLANIIVASRPGYDFTTITDLMSREPFAKYQNKVQCMSCDSVDISSTELRTMLKNGQDCSRYVPEAVLRYIEKNRLYL